MTECESYEVTYTAKSKANPDCGCVVTDVATRWYRAPEIMLSFANYVGHPPFFFMYCI